MRGYTAGKREENYQPVPSACTQRCFIFLYHARSKDFEEKTEGLWTG